MKFSEQWLREWVSPPVDTEALADQLTFLGLEVDEVVSAAPDFSDVVVARIAAIDPHPGADRLRICQVEHGEAETIQVICGAPNARAGLLTALARVGGTLPDGTRLKKAKLRGEVSMGMLCSAAELGLSDEADGIMELDDKAVPGTSLTDHLGLDDHIIDIELTPDRGDCLSIRGIARDLCAKNDLPMQLHEITPMPVQIDDTWPVQVDSDCACVRFTGRVIRDVDMSAPSPSWMVERLRRSGIRSINAAVDITNYVMLELGQPMHAFDLDLLQGGIQVRKARAGERLVLLDGRDVALDEDTTIIADDSGPVGIAGIMGGQGTGVSEKTRHIFFESALFLPIGIAGKPRHYASHTESAHRFERGVDPAGQLEALEYATGLLLNSAGGRVGPSMDWQLPERLPERSAQLVRESRLQRVLGIEPERTLVQTIFNRLGIASEPTEAGWQVQAPSYRYDLAIEEDYIEEVARVLGFDSIPRTQPSHNPVFRAAPETDVSLTDIKKRLTARGYQEVVTYSFVEAGQQSLLRPDLEALPLANPLSSELGVMRTTLLGGLINVLRHNLARQVDTVRIFETGLRFLPNDQQQAIEQLDAHLLASHSQAVQLDASIQQQEMIAGLIAGRQFYENWNSDDTQPDFYTLKADLENLLALAGGQSIQWTDSKLPLLHPGQQASIQLDGQPAGYLGVLSPELMKALDIDTTVCVFECAQSVFAKRRMPATQPLSRFPQVRRDLALVVDDTVSWHEIDALVRKTVGDLLTELRVFDIYQGDNIEKGKKSIAMGLILQDTSRTLEDSDTDRLIERVVAEAGLSLGAVLRV